MESNQTERKCPKCGGAMEVGYLRDRANAGASRAAEWAEGVPQTNWFFGIRVASTVRYQVEAFRCESCGFLEQYAVGPQKTGVL